MRDIIQVAINNQLKFRYVLMDTWFSSKENFEFISKKKKEFITALKSNRFFAKSLEDKQSIRGYLKGYDKEIRLNEKMCA